MKPHERLKHVRKNELKLSQQEFSSLIHMSRPNLGNIERGRIKLTDRVLADMRRVFQINPEWLMDGKGPMFLSDQDPLTFEILRLYSELTSENKNYLYGYIQRLFDEQSKKK